jgi:hypothetical protein
MNGSRSGAKKIFQLGFTMTGLLHSPLHRAHSSAMIRIAG